MTKKSRQLTDKELTKVVGGNATSGGIIGNASDNRLEIEPCQNSAGTESTGPVSGGICGSAQNYDLTIQDCYNSGKVEDNSVNYGGIGPLTL